MPVTAASPEANELNIYGYLSWRLEKVFDELSIGPNGETVKEDADRELTTPSFNVMMQYEVNDKIRTFVNLDGDDAGEVTVANIWGEYSITPRMSLRLGKTYRRFGIYNEQLDAVPTYIGIEPPELFDGDHLLISRETLVMLHGWMPLGEGDLRWALTTDNGEGGPSNDTLPIGFDLRYEWGFGNYVIGTSGYSSNGETTSDVAVGEGSPNTGVLPWMSADEFYIVGAFGEAQWNNLQLQAAYWYADHDAVRDPEAIVTVINNASVNTAQLDRFLIDPAGAVAASNVDTNGEYSISTWYVRAGYSLLRESGEWVPYAQWDFYENEETIQDKTWGGDNEAGLADDGKFHKATVGLIYRPVPEVAFKFDASAHIQEFNGNTEMYPEIRIDASYIFGR